MNRKLTLKDAVDYLEQLIDEEEANFMQEIETIYIQPPDEDGNVSGEDDANENEGGKVDDLNRRQLNAGVELVLRNGAHLESLDFEGAEENDLAENGQMEYVLLDVIHESQFNLSRDQPAQVIEYEQMEISSEEEEGAVGGIQLPDIVIEPWVNRLRKPANVPCDTPLPASNKDTTFTWRKEGDSANIPFFPEPNYDDCRGVDAHVLF